MKILLFFKFVSAINLWNCIDVEFIWIECFLLLFCLIWSRTYFFYTRICRETQDFSLNADKQQTPFTVEFVSCFLFTFEFNKHARNQPIRKLAVLPDLAKKEVKNNVFMAAASRLPKIKKRELGCHVSIPADGVRSDKNLWMIPINRL